MAGPAVRRILMVHVTGRSFATFNPKKVLLLEKTTRLKYEVMSHPSLSQEQLRAEVRFTSIYPYFTMSYAFYDVNTSNA